MAQPQASRESHRQLDRRIRASRFAVTAMLIASFPWLAYFTYLQDFERLSIVLMGMAGPVVGLILFWTGRHYLARVLTLAALVISFAIAACYFGGSGSPDLLFVVLLALPFVFFSRRYEWFMLTASVALTFGTAVFIFASDLLGLRDLFFSSPPRPLEAPELHSFGLKLTVAILITLEIGYFAWITEQATVASERALQNSDAAVRAKGAFLANMSHEIRTPMNGMMGMIEVLETTDLNARQTRVVGTIRNSASALLRIINDILDASKIEAGKLDVENAKVELRPLVEGIAQTMQTTADEADVRIRLLIDPDLPEWIMMDSGRLRQVLLNLLSNGVKYSSKRLTGRQGEVQVLAEQRPEGTLRFCITDNGVGMDPDFMARLFEPFLQAEASASRLVGGTGLGLVITRSLIELMRGHISVDSTPDRGTIVTVDLPLDPVKGPSRMPDLSGLDVICFDLLDQAARDGMERLLTKAGARVRFVRVVEDLARPDERGPAAPIILMPTTSDAQSLALRTAATAQIPDAKFVRFSSSRSARYGLQDPDCYLIQIFPMMTSELLQAIAVLGGRAGEPAHDIVVSGNSADRADGHPSPGLDDAKNHMILVAEDNEINQIVLSNQLGILGYPHEIAADGRAALEKWQSGHFDLILTDCHMPLMDGFELTAEIRRLESEREGAHTPIIAVTANVLEGEAEKCVNSGMDGYLAKPVNLGALKDKLALVLDKITSARTG